MRTTRTKTIFRWVVGAALLVSAVGSIPASELPYHLRAAVDAAIAKVKPSLVRIHVVSTRYDQGREIKERSVGSGVIITKKGHLITNHHVAGHSVRIFCTLANREEVEAEFIGTDAMTDISIIQLKPAKPREFPVAKFGDSAKLRVGDTVLAMGSPMALSQSVTLGIVSNTEMVMPRFFGPFGRVRQDGEDVGSLVRWVGHDAQIYGGNSGGPLVNLRGEIIGINEIRIGLAGAIPGNLAKSVADQIMQHGRVRRSWIGVEIQPLLKNSGTDRGVLISGAVPDSPAALADIRSGDILLAINKTDLRVRYEEQLPEFMRIVSELPIGKEATATVLRDGKEVALKLTPAEREELNPKQKEFQQWGLTARNISFLKAREMKRSTTDGVLVTSVRPGGPSGSAKPALNPDDVLVEVSGTPIKNLSDLIEMTRKLTHGATESTPVLATFERKVAKYLTVVKIGIEELKDPGLEVTKAWLPVETQVISRDIAQQLGQPNLKGFYVTQVYPGSNAEKAGLKVKDMILAVDDEKFTASGPEDYEELSTLIRQYKIGGTVKLAVQRDQTKIEVPVELARSPRLRREMQKYRNDQFEFTVRDMAFFDKADEQLKEEQRGVLVEEIKPGSWAELGSLYVDDVILEVNGQSVPDVSAFKAVIEKVSTAKPKFVVMKVLHGIHNRFVELEPDWKDQN
jgi:serine protease Do